MTEVTHFVSSGMELYAGMITLTRGGFVRSMMTPG